MGQRLRKAESVANCAEAALHGRAGAGQRGGALQGLRCRCQGLPLCHAAMWVLSTEAPAWGSRDRFVLHAGECVLTVVGRAALSVSQACAYRTHYWRAQLRADSSFALLSRGRHA